jgi:diamine N-acetyltransferase
MTTLATPPATSTPTPGTGHVGQAFLVGDEIYIRAIDARDAERGQSLASGIFPRSSSRHESWIKEELPKQKRGAVYTILRKADDTPVGTLSTWKYEPKTHVNVAVDPLYGEQALRWKAEALRLAIPWLSLEQHRPILALLLPAKEECVIEAALAAGAREGARYRERLRTWGGRTDAVSVEVLNPQWVERLGDPFETAIPRSGTGEARPVPAPVTLEGDPPANAMKVGPRVYLRPMTKDDAAVFTRLSRQDTETFWDAGRWMHSTSAFQHWTAETQKADPVQHVLFTVCLRESDEPIGSVGIYGTDYVNGCAESGSRIYRPEYRGGGYGSEAKHLVFDYAFNDLNLHTLYSTVIYPNTRSAAALRKQGYREVGSLHWDFPSHGGFENFVTFELLASEWRAMPRTSAGAEGDRS